MIDIALLHALAAAGATVQQIIAAVESHQKSEAEKLAAKREQGRQRQKTFRARNADTALHRVTSEKLNENNERVTLCNAPPPHPPIESKPSTSESCEVIPFAPTAQICPSGTQARKVITEFDMVLSDGTTVISAEEFEALNEEFGITNSRNLAGMCKREFLRDVRNGAEFIKRFRAFLTNNKTRKRAARPTQQQQQSEIDRLDAEHAARKKQPKGKYG